MKKTIATLAIAAACLSACEKKDDSVAKKTGEKIGETITDFASGVGKGVDKQMTIEATVGPTLSTAGVSITVAKAGHFSATEKRVSVYLIATKTLKGKLIARALDRDGQEIGRAATDADFAADDAKYVTFDMPKEMDSQLVSKYVIDLSTATTAPATAPPLADE